MNHDDQMAALRARIASAEAESDTWLTADMQEKYFEAYSRAEALSLQFSARHQAGLRALAECGPMPISEPDMVDEQERLMTSLAIRFDGRQYRYRDYRYDRLDDAVAYAELQLKRGE
jgi:hypothetical protein